MKKHNKYNLKLLLLAATIGYLGSYSASYIYGLMFDVSGKHVIGIFHVVAFFLLIFLICFFDLMRQAKSAA